MSVEIWDIDGTLTTTGDTPRQEAIDYLKSEVQEGSSIVIVSARSIGRLDETRAWLDDNGVPYTDLYLNDLGDGNAPAADFKRYKFAKLIEEYGLDEIDYVVDNDEDMRAVARDLGLTAYDVEEVLSAGEAETPEEEGSRQIDMKQYEQRSVELGEFRIAETETGEKTFTGYAAVFAKDSAGLPFTEQIAPGAFKRSLSRASAGQAVIKFLHGHDENRMLASTASGRLSLAEDDHGLKVEARLDPADPDAAAIISKLTHEAAAMGMSFGFMVPRGGDKWDGDKRTITEARLLEVSILSGHNPAYPATIGLSAVRQIAQPRLGIDAERLMNTLDLIRTGQDLTDEDVKVIETVKQKLAPRAGVDPSVLALRHRLNRLMESAD